MLLLQPLLLRSLWTINGVRCTVGAAAIQIDYSCHCWSTWNGWPLLKWSQAAYKCTLYKQSTGGQSAWDRYLMETSSVYCRLHGERWMATWTAAKCLQTHMRVHTHKQSDMQDTPMCIHSHTRYTHGVPKQIKPSVELISVCCSARGQSPHGKHITHCRVSQPGDQPEGWEGQEKI